jgi:uncharacterized protein
MSTFSTIIGGGLIGLGVASGGFLAGESLVKSRLGFRTVTVKALSEREVKANLGFWPVRFVVTGATLEGARSSLEVSQTAVRAFLMSMVSPRKTCRCRTSRLKTGWPAFW